MGKMRLELSVSGGRDNQAKKQTKQLYRVRRAIKETEETRQGSIGMEGNRTSCDR